MFSVQFPPPLSQSQWVVQVLTLDYLIDGYTDERGSAAGFLHLISYKGKFLSMWLASARLQPTGSQSVPVHQASICTIPLNDAFVGVIPRDEASAQYAQNARNDMPLYAVQAEAYVGPYVMRGTLLSPNRNIADIDSSFAMQDAEIDCLTPGAQLHGLRVPYIVVHSPLIQAIMPLG